MSLVKVKPLLLIPGLAWLLACGVDPIDNGPARISLTADRTTATTEQEVEFFLSAAGPSITKVDLDFGDGSTETVEAFGATTVSARRRHAFAEAGSYTVTATLTDAFDGMLSDDVTVEVTGAVSGP